MLALLIAAVQLPPPVVPQGWGVNIHFTDEHTGEVAKLAKAFRWVRMDFMWHQTERERGKYDFRAYDRLIASLTKHGVRPYFILDYGNDLYQKGSPRTPESRAAFCRWVAAAMAHYKGRGIIWEMWNEPNIMFWQPKPNVEEYILLARAVGETIRRVAPKETYVGPATSGFDWAFLQRCLDAGLLKYWDAVSVHPYRQTEPETVEADWLRLRAMLDRAGGAKKPMLSGEWGYSELYSGQSRERQAQMIARQYLVNLRCGVPISIWYDWKDDGTDPKETEHHFGTVSPDLADKPAYAAAERLSRELSGFRFVTRLHTQDDHQWLLVFRKRDEICLIIWTTGERRPIAELRGALNPSSQPTVVRGPALASLARAAPQPWALTSRVRIDPEPLVVRTPTTLWKSRLEQRTYVYARHPLNVSLRPSRLGQITLGLDNPYGRRIAKGAINIAVGKNPFYSEFLHLGPKTGFPIQTVLKPDADAVSVVADGQVLRASIPRYVTFALTGATASADGDAKVRASVSATETPEGVRLAYDFEPGWRFAELKPAGGNVEGKPSAFGLWIKGNGSGDLLRMRYADATGQTFQPDGGAIDWKGWRYVSFPLDGSGGRWGGANDGKVHWPIRITTAALVDMPGGRGGKGEILLARPTLAYTR